MKKNTKKSTTNEEAIAKAAQELAKEVRSLKDLETFEVLKHPFKFMWFSFLKGLMIGLGGIFAATVVLSFIIFVLSKIQLVPIIGDFVGQITTQVQNYQK